MQTALEAVHEYYATFSTLDLRAILSCYCEPCMVISPQGVISAANRTALAEFLTPMIDAMRRNGYGRSEFVQPQVTTLGESDALVQGVAVRYTAAGSEMERIAFGYLMHRTDAGWKIATLVAAGRPTGHQGRAP
jgi:ketosteroid isomerase-like protein